MKCDDSLTSIKAYVLALYISYITTEYRQLLRGSLQ